MHPSSRRLFHPAPCAATIPPHEHEPQPVPLGANPGQPAPIAFLPASVRAPCRCHVPLVATCVRPWAGLCRDAELGAGGAVTTEAPAPVRGGSKLEADKLGVGATVRRCAGFPFLLLHRPAPRVLLPRHGIAFHVKVGRGADAQSTRAPPVSSVSHCLCACDAHPGGPIESLLIVP